MKTGQIAHLDGDPNNNVPDNLAYLCLEHHDEFDGRRSQSKGLTVYEVKRYRDELSAHFGAWLNPSAHDHILNFLASTIDVDAMADAAVKVAHQIVAIPMAEELAFDVLITDAVDYEDGDLYIPHLIALDHYASWGWLTYTEEERKDRCGTPRMFITAQRKPICDDVAERIKEKMAKRGADLSQLLSTQKYRGWKGPTTSENGKDDTAQPSG